ncbi:UNVERIFIED_CONTAM: hypothetical protein HDU68_005348 [Siphonaria sp. JEL0065]|nr:hypothetical protein HDU68_005348 [Siphonaria sp. JEL0065]
MPNPSACEFSGQMLCVEQCKGQFITCTGVGVGSISPVLPVGAVCDHGLLNEARRCTVGATSSTTATVATTVLVSPTTESTTTALLPTPKNDASPAMNTALVISIVAIVLLLLVGVFIFFLWKKRKQAVQDSQLDAQVVGGNGGFLIAKAEGNSESPSLVPLPSGSFRKLNAIQIGAQEMVASLPASPSSPIYEERAAAVLVGSINEYHAKQQANLIPSPVSTEPPSLPEPKSSGKISNQEIAVTTVSVATATLNPIASRSLEVLNEPTPKPSRRATINNPTFPPVSLDVIANALKTMEPEASSSAELNFSTARASFSSSNQLAQLPAPAPAPALPATPAPTPTATTAPATPFPLKSQQSATAISAAALISSSKRASVRGVFEKETGTYTPPPTRAPKASHAVTTTFSPTRRDEILLALGDLVCVVKEFQDGWVQILNLTTKLEGVVPGFCLSNLEGGAVSRGTVVKDGEERQWTAGVQNNAVRNSVGLGAKKQSVVWDVRKDSLL